MQNADTMLDVIGKRGARGLPIERLYRQLFNPQLYTVNREARHIHKLADLNKPGRPDKPAWTHIMAKRRRKTLVLCRRCHEDIHAGRATTPTRK